MYIGAINGLTAYEPPLDASNLEHVQGYVDAFDHLCQAEEWDKAKKMLLICLNTPTHDDLGTQLGTWGYLEEQAKLYGKLYNKIDDRTDALCMKGLGAANHYRNNIEKARDFYERAIALFQAHGEYGEAAWIWHSLGLMETDQGNQQQACAYHEKALKQFRELEDYKGVASVLQDLARAEAYLGESAEAREHFEASLKIHADLKVEDKKGRAWACHNFGRFLVTQEEYSEALRYTEMAFDLFREMGYGLGISWSYYYLSIHKIHRGGMWRACVYIRKALELFREQENRGGIAWACHILGAIALGKEDYDLARQCYQEKLRIHQAVLRNKVGIATALEGFAHLAVAQNNLKHGARLFGAAKALRERIEFPLLRSDRVPRLDHVDYQNSVAAIQTQMDEAAFTEAWEAGRAMSMEQAIAEALNESEQ